MQSEAEKEKIAIVGFAFRLPGDLTSEIDLWEALAGGRDMVSEVGSDRWATQLLQHPKRGEAGRSVTFSAGVLSRIDEFDAGFFGISPREAAWIDPQQRLLLELAWEALENAGLPPSRAAGSDCAVYVGISGLDYGMRNMDDLASMSTHTMTGNTLSIAANRLSYVFDLHGPSMAIDTACSSSLVALHQACNALRLGEASMAMVGGVNLLAHPYPFVGFSRASMLSARGRCHTFDASGDGYVRAEGGAVLLLKPLAQAEADGDRIHALILASGVNADGGRKTGLTIPSRDGQVELMRSVLARAGITASDVDYLEAHGTGTAIGDPIETAAIGEVYGQARIAGAPLPIGSIKSNVGHLEPASGMAGLLKALLVLKHRSVPPSINLTTPNPKIDFAGWCLRPVTEMLSLAEQESRPLNVGVNSFGFGGANAHVLLQEYVLPAVPQAVSGSSTLPPLLLSAKTEAALRELAGRFAQRIESLQPAAFYDLAYSAAYGRDRLEKRLIVRGASVASVVDALSTYADATSSSAVILADAPAETGGVAFVYAGNGSQWIGMGQLLLAESPRFAEIMAQLEQKMLVPAGFSVIDELQATDSASRMDDTAVAQPLLFAIQYTVTQMLRDEGHVPDVVLGHSVGEVAAAWAAEALTLDEAVHVICARSAAQALTRGAGRMAAISLSAKVMQDWLDEGAWPDLEIAGYNSPGNLTLSGPLVQLDSLAELAKLRGVVFKLLDLDYAFHSRYMDPVEAVLSASLDDLAPTSSRQTQFVSTVTGNLHNEPLTADYWWDNVRQPVRFQQAIERALDLGCRTLLEISPHAILQRYLKECLAERGVKAVVLPSLRKNDDGEDCLQALALRLHLLAAGDSLVACFPSVGQRVDLPAYPWQRERHWLPNTVEGYRLIARERIHPLLGWPLKDVEFGWENVLDPKALPWLNDHRVAGAVVLPGAAYIEMALVAAQQIFSGDTQEVEELDIVSPIVFDGEYGRSTRFEFNARDGSFQIRSRQRLSEDDWALNACGRLLGAVAGYVEQASAQIETLLDEIDHSTHYRLAGTLGLDYGPIFQGLKSSRLYGDYLSGEFLAPLGLGADSAAWILHPAMVDVCFQSLLDFFQKEIEAGFGLPLLPVKVGRLRLLRSGSVTRFRTSIRRRSLRSVLADFELLTADGEQLAVLTGCRFRAASLRQGKQVNPACWQIVPIVQPSLLESSSTVLPQVNTLQQQLKMWFIDHEEHLQRRAYFDEAQPLFDALVTAFVYEAVRSLLDEPSVAFEDRLGHSLEGVDESGRLLGWARDLLVEQGYLKKCNENWQLIDSDMPLADEIWRALLTEYPNSLSELLLIGRRGNALPDLLGGRVAPCAQIGQITRSQQLDSLYDDSITYKGTRQAIEQLLLSLAGNHPPTRRFRVLEITAGLSNIPQQLAHCINPSNVDYVLANGDAEVCDQLIHEYQDADWVSVAEFNAEAGTLKSSQPIPPCFDVVVLRHVLWASSNAVALLAWTKSRLAAGGLVVLAERQSDLASDLIWGSQSFQPPVVWENHLIQLGFETVESCREPAGEASPVGCYLVLGKRGASEAGWPNAEIGRWLLLAGDEQGLALAESLCESLAGRGQVATIAFCDNQLLTEAGTRELLDKQRQDVAEEFEHVIFLAAERTADDIDLPVEALHLVRVLAIQPKLPRLTWVTRGALPVDGLLASTDRNPAHTALWGLGRVVMNEYPGLSCRLLDFSGSLSVGQQAQFLAEECLAPDGETEIIRHANGRHVLRMQSSQLAEANSQNLETVRYRLDFRVPGQLRNLIWLGQPEIELASDEVEVKPRATGLNFRDVMYVMGLLPDEAVEHGFAGASLGLEFSGVVTRVGSRVDEFAPGDAVMGFGSACFSSHVVTRAGALIHKPESWSFDAAATVPTVFFTVYYALKQLANVQPGERVLVHGGAGGVGIAAIQLARYLGAEVFATAGSAEKRLFVQLLGADHVFDSRSLAYADQILALTQGEGVDVVLNSLAGEAIRRNLHVLRPFGRFLELGKRDFFENTPIGLRPFKDNISYFGIDADQLLIARPDLAARLFREVMALFRNGILSTLPVRTFPAAQVVDAFRFMQQSRQIGKVVVTFDGDHLPIERLETEQKAIRFDPQACYLVTGGISGFGLETARWLAKHGAGQLLLLSRRGQETPGATEALASLRAYGTEPVLVACDVADLMTLQAVLVMPGLKPLKGVFHAAMVIDDALMANLDADRMRSVLNPKIRGGWNLHSLTKQLALDYFMLYSSVTTYIGNPGQANYVAGNAWLEGLACLRRAEGLPVTCIAWGAISDAGYLTRNQAVKDSLANRLGAEALTAQAALGMLGRALAWPQSNVSIGDFQFATLARLLPSAQGPRFTLLRRLGGDGGGAESMEDFRALIEGKSAIEVQAIVARLVTQEVSHILAISTERIDPTRSLHDLGLDSLMGVELALGLEKRFGIQVPAMLLNEGPTVERVTARIAERLFAAEGPTDEPASSLTATALGMVAQHGESVSPEFVAAAIAEVEQRGVVNES
ncbi:MAG: beta-ketoacyl synthase N-terminal-like domain-containing protein [Rhodocyclaceae bacterium]|nr:beta-ketoacyl synthase N-terminal-like domain-containing protein [Rhodocyclaceae bacterium]